MSRRKRSHVLNLQNKLCDDLFRYLPNKEPISSYFENFLEDKRISVLNLRDNDFTQPETIRVISRIVEKFPNLKLVDVRGNYFGEGSWQPLKDLIEGHDFVVDINRNLLLMSSDCKLLSSFTEKELARLIWLPIDELESRWGSFIENDQEKIQVVIRTHRFHYYGEPPRAIITLSLKGSHPVNFDEEQKKELKEQFKLDDITFMENYWVLHSTGSIEPFDRNALTKRLGEVFQVDPRDIKLSGRRYHPEQYFCTLKTENGTGAAVHYGGGWIATSSHLFKSYDFTGKIKISFPALKKKFEIENPRAIVVMLPKESSQILANVPDFCLIHAPECEGILSAMSGHNPMEYVEGLNNCATVNH